MNDETPVKAPLYVMVRQEVVRRIVEGEWSPGMALPSEQDLASELGVSQGTVRKAIDALVVDHVIVRKQGVGSFIAAHSQRRELMQFYKIVDQAGERVFPNTMFTHMDSIMASDEDARRLGLARREKLWRILRFRSFREQLVMIERIYLASSLFRNLDRHAPLPNYIYQLYEKEFGVSVANVTELLFAEQASGRDAEVLGLAEGAPVLGIERVAYALDGQPIELRRTILRTDEFRFLSESG